MVSPARSTPLNLDQYMFIKFLASLHDAAVERIKKKNKPVEAIFWPWLGPCSVQKSLEDLDCQPLARQQTDADRPLRFQEKRALCDELPQSVSKVVLQKSILTLIRQRILYISNSKG